MPIRYHPHALERLAERGATKAEVEAVILEGERFPARFDRQGFRRNFSFGAQWKGKFYAFKQVEVFAVEEAGDWLVITVITRFF